MKSGSFLWGLVSCLGPVIQGCDCCQAAYKMWWLLCPRGCRPRGTGESNHPLIIPWCCTLPVVSLYLAHVFANGLSIQFSSVAQLCLILCDPMNRSTPGLPVHHQLLEFTQTHVHRVGDAIQPSHPLVPFSSCPQSFPASGSFQMSQLFVSGGQRSFSFSISPSNEHPGLISFRMDWLDLLAVQGTLKSLFQHHSSKASILFI